MSELIHPKYTGVNEIGMPLSDNLFRLEQILAAEQTRTDFLVVARNTHLATNSSGGVGYLTRYHGEDASVVAETEFFLAPHLPTFDSLQLNEARRPYRQLLLSIGLETNERGTFGGGVDSKGDITDFQLYRIIAYLDVGRRGRILPPYEYYISDGKVLELLQQEGARENSSLGISEYEKERVLMRIDFSFFPDERLAQLMYQYSLGRKEKRLKINPILEQILGVDNRGIGIVPLKIVRAAVSGEANPYSELKQEKSPQDKFTEGKKRLQDLSAYSRLRARFENLNLRNGLPRNALIFGDLIDMMLLAYGIGGMNLSPKLLTEIEIVKNALISKVSPAVKGVLTRGYNALVIDTSRALSQRHHSWLNMLVDLGQFISELEDPEDPGSIGITTTGLTIAQKQDSEDLYELAFPDLDEDKQYVAAIFKEIGLPVRQQTS